MAELVRCRDRGLVVGSMPTGSRNSISDVVGVRVGHATLSDGAVQTGVTAIIPGSGNPFPQKLVAACHVINGFGKTMGLPQVAELGTLEAPIILTNTLSVGAAADALVGLMLERNPTIGLSAGTVNPVVAECNDGYLNDIRGRHVHEEHVRSAVSTASSDFSLGAVGAGTGMSCFELKGGIGSSSRVLYLADCVFTLGVVALTNFGILPDLVVLGVPVGRVIAQGQETGGVPDAGSVIVVFATDAPLSARQIGRIARRAVVGLCRTGSYIGGGSGDIVVGFTTANKVPHEMSYAVSTRQALHEDVLDIFFRALAESVEEAVLDSMFCAPTTVGRDGHIRRSLSDYSEVLRG